MQSKRLYSRARSKSFAREYQYILEVFANPLFYFSIVALVFPWTLWLAGGLVAPFADRETKRDR